MALKLSKDLLRLLQIYIHLTKMIQQKNDFQNVTNNNITNNTSNTSATERSKKSRKVSHCSTTPSFVNRQQQQQQQQQQKEQHCLFFNYHLENDICYKKVVPLSSGHLLAWSQLSTIQRCPLFGDF